MNKKKSIFLKLYSLISPIIAYIWIIRIFIKSWGERDEISRIDERMGISSCKRPKGKLIWFHAVSLGESISILPLIKLLVKNKNINVLITSSTASSAYIISKQLPNKAIHQFSPIDYHKWIDRFIDHWKPNIALRVESELWPNTLNALEFNQIPILLLNGRISQKSFKKWKTFPKLARDVIKTIDLILAQSQNEAKKFEQIGAENIVVIGNLKNSSPPLPIDSIFKKQLAYKINNRPVWVAASIHNKEEQLVINTHIYLKKIWPNILTIIAPRHPEHEKKIKQISKRLNLKCSNRTDDNLPNTNTDIFILNTYGELGTIYSITPIVFIGKSLSAIGGQNPLEPSRFGCQLLFGPHMENFLEISQEILERDIGIQVENQQSLNRAVSKLFKNPKERENIQKALNPLLEAGQKKLSICYEKIINYMN